jgi:hypothetical protein
MLWALSTLRRCASLLAVLWLCAWLTPLIHQAQCTAHHHDDTTCPICQLATTASIAAPSHTAPTPVRATVERAPCLALPAPALLFQIEHPPRGPPPAAACV